MTTALALYERMGFVRVPQYDVNPAAILGLDPSDSSVTALAYWLAINHKENQHGKSG
jgi:hypothetical protein